MMEPNKKPSKPPPVILILDDDVIARVAIANYLRECGYQVIEAATALDARTMIIAQKYDIDIVICTTTDDRSAERFGFSRWVRDQFPRIRVLLAANVEKTAKLAADICEEGPHL